MDNIQIKKRAKEFAEYWADKGYEKGESQKFWLNLLRDVLGVEHPEQYISFEDKVKLDHTSFIDGFIPSTHVLIEQKGRDKDLRKPIRQSDGTLLTPFQQAKRYSAELPYSQRPRWIITCNFQEFLIYDMEKPNGEPESILLKNFAKEYYRLQFIVNAENENIKKAVHNAKNEYNVLRNHDINLKGLIFDSLLAKKDSEYNADNKRCADSARDKWDIGKNWVFHPRFCSHITAIHISGTCKHIVAANHDIVTTNHDTVHKHPAATWQADYSLYHKYTPFPFNLRHINLFSLARGIWLPRL